MEISIPELLNDVKKNGCSSKILEDYCNDSMNGGSQHSQHDHLVRKIICDKIASDARRPDPVIYDFLVSCFSEAECNEVMDLMVSLIKIRNTCGENQNLELKSINRLIERYPKLAIPHFCESGHASRIVSGLSKSAGTYDVIPDLLQAIKIFSGINNTVSNQKGRDRDYYDVLLYDDGLYKDLIRVLATYEDGSDTPSVQLWLLYQLNVFLKKSIDSTTLFDDELEACSANLLDMCIKRGDALSGIVPSFSLDEHGNSAEQCGEWIIASVLHLLSVKYQRNRPDLFREIISVEHSKTIRDVTGLNVALRLNKSRSVCYVEQIDGFFEKNPHLRSRIADRIRVENEDWMPPPKEGYGSLLAPGHDPQTEGQRLAFICGIFKNKSSVKEEHLSLLLSIMEASLQTEGLNPEYVESSINALDLLLKHTIDIDYCATNTTASILAVLEIAYKILPRQSRINVDGTLVDHINEVLSTSLDYLFAPSLKVLKLLSERGTSKLESVFSICSGINYLDVKYDDPGFETSIIRGLSDSEARLYASEFISGLFHTSMLPDYSEKRNVIDTLLWMLCDGTKKVKDNSMDALMNILQRTSIDDGRCMKILEWIDYDSDPERNSIQCKLIYYMYKSGSIDDFGEYSDKLVNKILMRCISTPGQEDSVFWAANVFSEIPINNPAISIDVIIQLLDVVTRPQTNNLDDISISQIFEAVYHIGRIIKKSDEEDKKKTIRMLVKELFGEHYISNKGTFNSFGRMLSTLSEADLWKGSESSDDDYSILDAIKDCVDILRIEDNTAVLYWVLRCLSKLMDELEGKDHRIDEKGVEIISDAMFGMMELRDEFSKIGGYDDYGVRAQISMVIKKSYNMSTKHQLFVANDRRLIGIWDTEGDSSWEVQKNTALVSGAYVSEYQDYDTSKIPKVLDLFSDENNHNYVAGDLRYGLKFATKIFSDKEFAKQPEYRKELIQMTINIIKLLKGQMELHRTYTSVGIKKTNVVEGSELGYVVNLFDYGIIAEISKTLRAATLKFNTIELIGLVDNYSLIALLNRVVKDIPDYGTIKHTLRVLDELAEKGICSGSTVQVICDKLLIRHENVMSHASNDYGVMTAAVKTLASVLTNVTDSKSDILMPLMDDTVIHLNLFKSPLDTFKGDDHIKYWVLRCLMPLAKCHANLDMEGMILGDDTTLVGMTLSRNSAIRRMSSILIGYGLDSADKQLSEKYQNRLSDEYRKVSASNPTKIIPMLNSLSTLTQNSNVKLDNRFDMTYLLSVCDPELRGELLKEVSKINSSELSIRDPDQTLEDVVGELANCDIAPGSSPDQTVFALFDCIKTILDSHRCSEECLESCISRICPIMNSYLAYIDSKLSDSKNNFLRNEIPGCQGYDYYRALETISITYMSCLSAGGISQFRQKNPLLNYLNVLDTLPHHVTAGSGSKQSISVRILISKVILQTVSYEIYTEELENKTWERIIDTCLENIKFENSICRYNSLATLYIAQAVLGKGTLYDTAMMRTVRAIDDEDLICYQDNMSVSKLSSHVLRRFARCKKLDVLYFDNIRSLMENNVESSMNEAMDMIPILEVLSTTFIDRIMIYVHDEEKTVQNLNIMQYNDLRRSLVAASYILSTASYKRSSRSDEGIRHMAARISSRIRLLDCFERKSEYAIPILKYMTCKANTTVEEVTDNSEPLDAINQAHMIVYTFSEVISSSNKEIIPSIEILLGILSRVLNRYDGLLSLVNMGRIKQIDSDVQSVYLNKLIDQFQMGKTKQEYELLSQCIVNIPDLSVNVPQDFIDRFVLERLEGHMIFFSTANNILAAMNQRFGQNIVRPIHYARFINLMISQLVLSTLYIQMYRALENITVYFDGCYDSTDLQSISKLIKSLVPVMRFDFLSTHGCPSESKDLKLVDRAILAVGKIYNQTGISLPLETALSLLKDYIGTDVQTAIRIFLITNFECKDGKEVIAEYDEILKGYSSLELPPVDTRQYMLELIVKACRSNVINSACMPILESGIKDREIKMVIRLAALDAILICIQYNHKPTDINALEKFLSATDISENADENNTFRTKVALIIHKSLGEMERMKVLDRETIANIALYVKDDYDHKPIHSFGFKRNNRDE